MNILFLGYCPQILKAVKSKQILSLGLISSALLINSSYSMAQSQYRSSSLSLNEAIRIAQTNDDWLARSELIQARLMHLSDGADAWPDPTISISMLNLPVDSFALDQEPMTQFKLGATQMLPRGDTLSLQQKKYQVVADEQPFQRDDRKRKVALYTSQLWLDAYKSNASYRLVEQAKPLFDKLGAIVSASYAASSGSTRQQDIISAELELLRLNDRLVELDTQRKVALAKLSQYLFSSKEKVIAQEISHYRSWAKFDLPTTLAPIAKHDKQLLRQLAATEPHIRYQFIEHHPMLGALTQRIRASSVDIELAEQRLKPQFGLNASYAFRDDPAGGIDGNNRADFFSIGMSLSLPLFSNKQRDADIAGSVKMHEAVRTEKRLLIRELIAGLSSAYENYLGAAQRYDIYMQQILPKTSQQAQVSTKAYTNDIGNFDEVLRAKIAELDTKVTLLEIEVYKRKALAQLHYFITLDNTSFEPTVGAEDEQKLKLNYSNESNRSINATAGAMSYE